MDADAVTQKYKNMFLASALFNVTAALLVFFPNMSYGLLGVTPVPNHDFVLHVACLLVGCLGVGYSWAAQDFPGNANIIYLGMGGKSCVVALAVLDVVLGVSSWQLLLLVGGDAVFAYLFYHALQDLKNTTREKRANKTRASKDRAK